ncbi:MAG: ATP-binding protein, partial [Lachnospiraceae bacterium]|nr:ATP-binding protein [Lachnospiraceae bacterium]
MRKRKPRKIPSLNGVVITAMFSVIAVFAAMILFVSNLLFTQSIENAKAEDIKNATQISISLKDNLNSMSQLLRLIQHSFAEIDLRSRTETASTLTDRILMSILNVKPDVHSAWAIFSKGVYLEDELYIREYVRQDGEVVEGVSLNHEGILEDHDSAPWYYEPLNTGNTYFTAAELYKYTVDSEAVYAATISMPIFINGEILGVCGIDILYSDTMEMINNLHNWQNRVVMLFNEELAILHAFDSHLINKNIADFSYEDLSSIRDAVNRGEVYAQESISPIINEKVFLHILPIPFNVDSHQQTLYLLIGTPLSQLNAEANNIIATIVLVSFVCIMLIPGIIFINVNRLVKPLKDLASFSQQIAANDSQDNIFDMSEYSISPKNEIYKLWYAFNEMLLALRKNLRTVEERVEERTRDFAKLNNYVELLINGTSTIYFLMDQDLSVLYCSRRYMDLMYINDMSEIIGKSFRDINKNMIKGDAYDRYKNRISRVLSGEDNIIEDDIITWPNGEICLYRILIKLIKDDNNNFEGISIILRDLTDVRIEESDHRMNDMLYSSQMPCLAWDEKGNIVAFNKLAALMFDLSEDLSCEHFNELYFSAIQPKLQFDDSKTGNSMNEFLREAFDKGFSQFTGRLVRQDGTLMFVSVTAARIAWISGYRIITYLHDTTELMKREESAKKTNERTRIMLDAAPLCIYFLTRDGMCIDCNKETVALFGLSSKKEFFKRYIEISPEYQPNGRRSNELRLEILEMVFQEGAANFEWNHINMSGELIPCDITLIRTQYQDEDAILVYARDLREVKAKEQQLKEIAAKEQEAEVKMKAAQVANETKSRFLADMSHEIRTPMNAVLGMSELLLQDNLNKRQLGHVLDIKTCAMSLLDIINDILDVSKIQSGKFTLVPIHYDFSIMIDNIGSIVQFLVEDKNIDFRLTMPEQGPVYLYGDNVRLRQVLLNLLGNAVKFTVNGHVELAVDFTDDTVKLTVSDTGAGIPSDSIATLFDAFEQADVEKHRDKTGTGLGLTISKSIVEMMNGQITVESVYGEGTSFHIEIPKIIGDIALIQHSDDKDINIYAPDAKVLVVDDIKTNLSVACGLLQLCGITAETAESGSEAIELIKRHQYDIVFMDHRMPGMSGIETTKVIREAGIGVTIVALTASAVVGAKEMMLDAGMDDFLWKPIKKTEMLHILKKWIP